MKSNFLSGWYAILPSKKLKNKPIEIERFSQKIVLWRKQNNTVIAMKNHCPHRGAKLSLGKVCNDHIQCPYHGYEFSDAGHCEYAPEMNSPLPGLTVNMYPVKEDFGMIWIYWGNEAADFNPTHFEKIHHDFKGHYSQTSKRWHSHISYCIENQLDYTHLPLVHHNTIGRHFNLPKNPSIECTAERIATYFDGERLVAELLLPNIWILHAGKKIKIMLFFAPINEHETLLYLRTYRSFVTFQPLKPLVDWLMNLANKAILKQDQKVVASQGKEPSYMASEDNLFVHDKAIKHFRGLFQSAPD